MSGISPANHALQMIVGTFRLLVSSLSDHSKATCADTAFHSLIFSVGVQFYAISATDDNGGSGTGYAAALEVPNAKQVRGLLVFQVLNWLPAFSLGFDWNCSPPRFRHGQHTSKLF